VANGHSIALSTGEFIVGSCIVLLAMIGVSVLLGWLAAGRRSACDPVAGFGYGLDDLRVAELGAEAADSGPDRLAERVGCLVPDAFEDLLSGHDDAGCRQEDL
jgi:hypothetical protein